MMNKCRTSLLRRLGAVFALLSVLVIVALAIQVIGAKAQTELARSNGDVNGDQRRDLSDAVYILTWLFNGGPEPVAIAQDASGCLICDPATGNVGIGTHDPLTLLHMRGSRHAYLRLERPDQTTEAGISLATADQSTWNIHVDDSGTSGGNDFQINAGGVEGESEGTPRLRLPYSTRDVLLALSGGNVGVGTDAPLATLHVNGTSRCRAMEIEGGADLAERFDIFGEPTPGTPVSADPENPGRLRVADQPYDESLIGVISGAGGLHPGLVLHQEGVATGQHAVALVGRAYVLADASFGEILPGMALTTSASPGHAMRVGDKMQAIGSVLGTALSGLKHGKGLVLVAINRR